MKEGARLPAMVVDGGISKNYRKFGENLGKSGEKEVRVHRGTDELDLDEV